MTEDALKKNGPHRAIRLIFGYILPSLQEIRGQLIDVTARVNSLERDQPVSAEQFYPKATDD